MRVMRWTHSFDPTRYSFMQACCKENMISSKGIFNVIFLTFINIFGINLLVSLGIFLLFLRVSPSFRPFRHVGIGEYPLTRKQWAHTKFGRRGLVTRMIPSLFCLRGVYWFVVRRAWENRKLYSTKPLHFSTRLVNGSAKCRSVW